MNNTTHHCYKEESKETDFLQGINSPIVFRSILADGNWESHNKYFERQKFSWDNEGCVIFACQESIDAQMDELISQGIVGVNLLELFNQMGFMDSVNSLDGKAHFHSSERYLQSLTGNGYNGNALTDPWDAARTYGIVPWTILPFDATCTEDTYLLDPMPQNILDIGQQFLTAVGGKDWIQYHWIVKALPTNTPAMDVARRQAPLVVAVLAESPGWNQVEPPIVIGPPCHGVQNYNSDTKGEWILDHYDPFEKVLQPGFPMSQVLQGIITITPPPAAPVAPSTVFPETPTPEQISQWRTWLNNMTEWLDNLLGSERLCGAKRSDKWSAVEKAFLKEHSTCVVCSTSENLNVHHIQPFHLHPELELEPTNLITLCRAHHFLFGHFMKWASFNKDVVSDCKLWADKILRRPE